MTTMKQASFNTLIDLTRHHVDKAGNTLSTLVTERRNAAQQLSMLQEYRQDYAARLNHAGQHGITASNYHNFTRFLATLDEAILQQTKVMANLDQTIDASKSNWRKIQRRLHSYETLQQRHETQHMALGLRREQIATDEMSAIIYRRSQADRGLQ